MSFDTNARPVEIQVSSDRSFGLVFMVFFLVLALWPLWSQQPVRLWSVGVALAFGLVAVLRPSLLHALNIVWAKFGSVLHKLMSPLVLGLMYFLVLAPIGLLLRLLGKDILQLKLAPEKKSYWVTRSDSEYKSTMKDQF